MYFTSPLFQLAILISLATAQHLNPFSVPESDATAPPHSQPTIKILVCGDSISQGKEFDFTWRYRLWEWFRDSAASHLAPTLQYVGPYVGTLPTGEQLSGVHDDPTIPPTWGAYHPNVHPDFIGAHFALYGRPAWQIVDVIQAQVETYQPDVVVLHLGFNDMAWWMVPPAELVERISWLVFNARLGRSDVGVLVAEVSSRLSLNGREDLERTTHEYNALLAASVAKWTTPESPVMLVKVSEDYDCHVESCPAGIDGLHPNALGDYQIARAYSKVLHEHYHIGSEPLIVPPVDTIPGMEGYVSLGPPLGMFVGLSFVCLLVVLALRRRWEQERGRARDMHSRLPTTIQLQPTGVNGL